MMKEKGVKNNKKQVKTSNKQKHESKLSERFENDGIDYEEELKKSKKLEIELRKDNELVCVEYDKLNMKRVHVETRYEALVEQLKDKLCRVIFMNQEEEYLEVEDIRKEIDDEFSLEIRHEYFDESEEEESEHEEEDMLCRMFDG